MEKSRLATYAVGALLALAAAGAGFAKQNELALSLGGAALFVLGYAKQHVADKPVPTPASEDTTKPITPKGDA